MKPRKRKVAELFHAFSSPTRLWIVALIAMTCCFLEVSATAELIIQRLHTSAATSTPVLFSTLTQGSDGNFYATVSGDSVTDYGSITRITPSGVVSTVINFRESAGNSPNGPLLRATDGNLYGTTMMGGAYGFGVLFRISSAGNFQVLHSFDGSAGKGPVYNLVQARDGYLYGVTGVSGFGDSSPRTVFRATTAGVVTALTNLSNPFHLVPTDGLVEGPDGWLYGTAFASAPGILGAIYKVSTNGTLDILKTFAGTYPPPNPASDDQPVGGLTLGIDGFLYGTVCQARTTPSTRCGSIFRISTNGAMTTLASFLGPNGSSPQCRLTLGSDGNFYGLTTKGGATGNGTIFRVTPDGVLTTVTNGFGQASVFNNTPSLTLGTDGNLYGSGLESEGTLTSSVVFRLVEPPQMTAANLSPGKVTLNWNSFAKGVYRVDYTTAMDDSNWLPAGASITATGRTTSVSFTVGASTQRFYRVVLLP